MQANTGVGSQARKRHGKFQNKKSFKRYTGGIPEFQSCYRETTIFRLSHGQPSASRFFRKGCGSTVDCFQKIVTESKKAVTAQFITQDITISILIQYETGPMGHTIKEKSESRRNKYESNLYPRRYCWSHGHKVIRSHTIRTCTNSKEGNQESAMKNNAMGGSTTIWGGNRVNDMSGKI